MNETTQVVQKIFGRNAGLQQPPGMERDAWIEVYDGASEDGEDVVHIRGAELIDRERWQDPKYDDAGHSLLCRCGSRGLWVRQIEQALDTGTRRLFV